MNPPGRVLIEKAAYENGWERTVGVSETAVQVASARHRATAEIELTGLEQYWVRLDSAPVASELRREWAVDPAGNFALASRAELAHLLQRAAQLAIALPPGAEEAFRKQVAVLPPETLGNTEALRLTRQRIGQDVYRGALMDYWGGACAVTGMALAPVLRASHARPWAECESDAQRLDVFNGFLLVANLDALFDQGLIGFDDTGGMLLSSTVTPEQAQRLVFSPSDRLRWIAPGHLPYLAWHRAHKFVA